MDWLSQNKFTKWFIIILVALNVATITMMWVFLARTSHPPPFNKIMQPKETVTLMQKELNLSNEQIKQFEKLRKENFDKSKKLMNQIDALKKSLSEELINENKDTAKVNSITNAIGLLQTEMEKLRFNHFEQLISLCTPEQKEKLKPILKNIIGGIPPRGGIYNDQRGFRGNKPPEQMPMDGRPPQPFDRP